MNLCGFASKHWRPNLSIVPLLSGNSTHTGRFVHSFHKRLRVPGCVLTVVGTDLQQHTSQMQPRCPEASVGRRQGRRGGGALTGPWSQAQNRNGIVYSGMLEAGNQIRREERA